MRSLKDHQHLGVLFEHFPQIVRFGHMPIDKKVLASLHDLHHEMAGNRFLPIIRHKGGKVTLAQELKDFFAVFFPIKFMDVHTSPLVEESITLPFASGADYSRVIRKQHSSEAGRYNPSILFEENTCAVIYYSLSSS